MHKINQILCITEIIQDILLVSRCIIGEYLVLNRVSIPMLMK